MPAVSVVLEVCFVDCELLCVVGLLCVVVVVDGLLCVVGLLFCANACIANGAKPTVKASTMALAKFTRLKDFMIGILLLQKFRKEEHTFLFKATTDSTP